MSACLPSNAFSGGASGLPLSGGTLTGALLIANGSAAAPSLMSAASSANLIGFYGTASSIIFSSYGSDQMAFATSWNSSALALHTNATVEWTANNSPTSQPDVIFGRGGAAATLQLGRNHTSTPTAQVFKAHNVTTGTGASLEIAGGTGSVARGNVTLNGGNRAAYVAPASFGNFAGSGTVDVVALETALSTVSSNVDAVINTLISHGLMAAS